MTKNVRLNPENRILEKTWYKKPMRKEISTTQHMSTFFFFFGNFQHGCVVI